MNALKETTESTVPLGEMSAQRRRSPRIRASLEIQVVGLESRPRMRRGDLSVTGVRFESPHGNVGDPGQVHTLRIATRDREVRVAVPARVVRIVQSNDLEDGENVHSVAFEFMPEDEAAREAVAMLFVHVARARIRHDARGVRPASEPPVRDGVHGLRLETDWQIRKGETLTIEVPLREGGTARFEGRAVRSRPSRKGSFRTLFELEKKESSFVSALPTAAEHMRGDLSRVRAPSLLALAAMERMSAVLTTRNDDRCITIYIRDGQIVDAEEVGSQASRRKLVGEVCQWEHGTFEMSLQEVERPDGIGVPTTVLLLQLARFYDEAQRVA